MIDCLLQAELSVDGNGNVLAGSDYFSAGQNILPHLLFTLKGKERPSDYSNFAVILAACKLPKDLICQKATTEIKRAKRHAKSSTD